MTAFLVDELGRTKSGFAFLVGVDYLRLKSLCLFEQALG